jgi:hypothetical protein
MINAKELMTGNYLYSSDGVVVEMDAGGIFDIWVGQEECSPIPLTEEWLERLGLRLESTYRFESGYNNTKRLDKTYTNTIFDIIDDTTKYQVEVITDSEGRDLRRIGIISSTFKLSNLQYVHELQNAVYVLYGEELTTK